MKTTRIEIKTGKFDWNKDNDVILLQVYLPDGAPVPTISATWDLGEEPEHLDKNILPSEAIAMIAEQYKSYLFATNANKIQKVVTWAAQMEDELDADYIAKHVSVLDARIKRLQKKLGMLKKS